MEHVNHPKHYNSHPNGIECIDIIRHYVCDIANSLKYLWRAGLKPEMGKEDAEKEIEDLKKALWYIEDYRYMCDKMRCHHSRFRSSAGCSLFRLSGHNIEDVTKGYDKNVAHAMDYLLRVGMVSGSTLYAEDNWAECLQMATRCIQYRILDIKKHLFEKETVETAQVLHGQAVDGEDYVSKPGCVRETEPEKYDPLNMIVMWGRVYSLTDEVIMKENGVLRQPCENCDLWSECHDWHDMPTPMLEESHCHYVCARIHNATEQQYYREVGVARYSPRYGTVEVVDELKDAQLRLERANEESDG